MNLVSWIYRLTPVLPVQEMLKRINKFLTLENMQDIRL